MSFRRFASSALRSALASALLVLTAAAGKAQQRPPAQPNPQAPTINMPAPMGMQRGTQLELTLTGTNLAEPTGLWTSFPAKIPIPTDNNNGKDNAKLRVLLDVPKDAPLGLHALRLATTRGMSNLRLFCLDDLPQVMEADTNHSRSTPQPVPVPCVVVGRADAEVSDYFKITVSAGQRLSFEILGRRLGSALDPQLTLFDAQTGRELPGGHSNDAPGLQTDPRLTYTFKNAGDYLVEVRDCTNRGGADFWYRLRIGDFPCATTPVPMAAKRGSKVTVGFAGPLVDGVAPVEVIVPTDPAINTVWVTPVGANGLPGWPVVLAVSDVEELVEQEPNNEPTKANRLTVPSGVTGRFLEKGDVDHYALSFKKGQRVVVEAQTFELGSPTDVYLTLKDAKGAQLAASNPMTNPRIDFTAPADGEYTLTAEHLLYWSGPAETYHLTVSPYQPGFDLSLALDRYDVAPGGLVSIPIFVARRDYPGPIEVSVVGPPGLSGQVTIPAGQPAQPNQPAATLTVTAKDDLKPGPQLLVLQGKTTINNQTVVGSPNVRAVLIQGLANLQYPPRSLLTQVAVAITEKPPFALTAKFDQPEALRGSASTVTVTATRAPGFDEEIALTASGLPANVTAAVKSIPKGQSEVKVLVTPAAAAALSQVAVSFAGKAKVNTKEFTVQTQPAYVTVVLPFDLKVEPLPVKVTPDGKAQLKVTAVRKGGYQGPIAVELRNLPANVTAAKGTIAMGQNDVTLEVTAAANAAAGDKTDVNVLGTATAAGNAQNASANFTVSVIKK